MAYIKKNKKHRVVGDVAVLCVKSTFNNTLVTVTTVTGDVLLRSSAGRLQYKGTRKGTPYVASQIGQSLTKDMMALGIKQLEINLQGIGHGRDSVVRSMQAAGFQINVLRDVTPIAFAGCRPPKRRRT
jgi:small subunit ribosomal protein S11